MNRKRVGQTEGAIHPSATDGDFITATDICTLMLYEKFNWKKISSAYGMDMNAIFSMDMNEIIKQGGIEEVMLREAEKTGSYELEMSTMSIEDKDLMKIKENLEFVDSLPLKELCRNAGQVGFAATFEDVNKRF